jgi:hypothetical protein
VLNFRDHIPNNFLFKVYGVLPSALIDEIKEQGYHIHPVRGDKLEAIVY